MTSEREELAKRLDAYVDTGAALLIGEACRAAAALRAGGQRGVAVEEVKILRERLALIAAQDQGCGGTVTLEQAFRSAQRIANEAIFTVDRLIRAAEAQVSQAGIAGSVPLSGCTTPGQSRPATYTNNKNAETTGAMCWNTDDPHRHALCACVQCSCSCHQPTIDADRPMVSHGDVMRERDALRAEVARLTALINDTGDHWLRLEPGIPWEGAIDSAMEAAVAEIRELRALNEAMRPVVEAVMEFHRPGGRWGAVIDAIVAYRRAKGDAK